MFSVEFCVFLSVWLGPAIGAVFALRCLAVGVSVALRCSTCRVPLANVLSLAR